MTLGMAGFVGNDALVKFVGESIAVSQVIFIRSLLMTVLLSFLALSLRVRLMGHALAEGRVLARAALDAAACVVFFTAVVHVPLANATAINMCTPLIIAAMAALALREKLSGARCIALGVGFAGVLLVVQPAGRDFNAWSLLMLLSALLCAGRDLVTRSIHERVSAIQIALVSSVGLVPISALWGQFETWGAVRPVDLGLVALAAVSATCGYIFITKAMRVGAVDIVVPFRYSAIVFATVLGFAIWGDLPNLLAWMGMATIVLSGVWLLRSR